MKNTRSNEKEFFLIKSPAVLSVLLFLSVPLFANGAGDAKISPEAPAKEDAPSAAAPQEKINAYFFYEELCGLCRTDVDRFYEILQEKLPLADREQYPNNIHVINAHESAGRSFYTQITDELGLDRGNLEPPLLILGGRVFQGYDSIRSNIYEAYLTAAEDLYVNKRPYTPRTKKTGGELFADYPVNPGHVTIVYYYRITCPECAKAAPLVDALPKTVLVNGAEKPLDIIRINTRSGNNGERIAAFFEAWQVPDEDRMVPIVFFAGSYLAGFEAISVGLNQAVTVPPISWRLLPETQ
jgi:thiol-disulfide isomerase/thioredoxin